MTEALPRPSLFARALAVLREDGLRAFGRRVLFATGCYRKLFLLARSLDEPIAEFEPGVPVRIGELAWSEIAAYFALRPDASHAAIETRFANGHRCFVAWHDGRAVATCWLATRPAHTDYLDCAVPTAPGDAYLFDAYTLPDYRGQRIAPAVCAHQLHACRAAGAKRAIRLTAPHNAAALAAHGKSGFRPIGVLGRVGVGRWRHFFSRSL